MELDLPIQVNVPAESLTFPTGGQPLDGTLALTVFIPPPVGTSHRVVYTTQGTGAFALIEGEEPFTEVVEDENGVLVSRPN